MDQYICQVVVVYLDTGSPDVVAVPGPGDGGCGAGPHHAAHHRPVLPGDRLSGLVQDRHRQRRH